MRFEVADDAGRVLASGRDLDVLRAELRPRLQAELTAAAARFERRGLTSWDGIGALPRTVALPGTGQTVRAYPALVDEGATAGVRMLETPEAQAASMAAGTRRLLLLGVGAVPVRDVTKGLPSAAQLALASAPHGSAAAVVEDATVAAVDALVASGGGPAWDAAGFERLRRHVAGGLLESVRAIVAQVVRVLDAEREVRRRLEALRAPSLREATMDVRQQLHRLVFDGFVAATGATCTARRDAWSACPTSSPPTRTACAPSTSSRSSTAGRSTRGRRAARCPRDCARSRGCSRSCASASSPRASAPASRCRPSASAARSRAERRPSREPAAAATTRRLYRDA
jgi:hypothetical protein